MSSPLIGETKRTHVIIGQGGTTFDHEPTPMLGRASTGHGFNPHRASVTGQFHLARHEPECFPQ